MTSLLIAINPFIGNSSRLSNVMWTKENEPCLCVGHACTSIYVKEERNKEKSEVVGGYSLGNRDNLSWTCCAMGCRGGALRTRASKYSRLPCVACEN